MRFPYSLRSRQNEYTQKDAGTGRRIPERLGRDPFDKLRTGFAVLDDPRWPLTNNAAERALRHWVILRHLTHGTRTERGSRGLALLASVIDTCRQRGHSPWDYLQTAVTRRRQNLALLPLPV